MEEHRPRKLLDQVRDAIRLKHYSYCYFHDVRHPSEMGAPEAVECLT
jgi:hypothetical protein